MPAVDVSDENYARLEKLAKPFVDTVDSVIGRALSALEGTAPPSSGTSSAAFDPARPPNLTHTKVLSMDLGSKSYPPNEKYWNYLLLDLVREAARAGKKPKEIIALVAVNAVLGERTNHGYRYVPEAGISIQGQDANGAWKGIYNLASSLNQSVNVSFAWYDNPKASQPGGQGRLAI